MKTQTFIKSFPSYDDAFEYMVMKNVSFKKAGNNKDHVNVVPGPDDDYCVVDDRTAIELGLGYVFSSNTCGWVANPWLK